MAARTHDALPDCTEPRHIIYFGQDFYVWVVLWGADLTWKPRL